MISFLIDENESIRAFFDGSDSYIPIPEYMYLHDRPLLRPNFVTQVEARVELIGQKIIRAKLTGKPIDKLSELAIILGVNMDGQMNETKARATLFALRDLYKLCNDLDAKLR